MKHIYNIDTLTENNKTIIYIFSRDDNNKKHIERKVNFKPYFFVDKNEIVNGENISEEDYISIDNKKLKKISVNNTYEMYSLVKQFKTTYEADIRPENRFIIDYENILKEKGYDFNSENAREICIDIETTISNEFPNVFNPKESITIITLFDSYTLKYFTFLWSKTTINNNKENIFNFNNEIDMLKSFIEFISNISPDIISGFNVIDFDLSYIIARCRELKINYQKLSPINKVTTSVSTLNGKKYMNIKIFGVSFIDIQEWYKQLRYGDVSSYALKNIAREELNETQESINTDFEWNNNIDKLINYNITDVRLTLKLSQKYEIKRFLNNLRILSHLNYSELWSYGRIIDILILKEAKKRSKILPTKPKTTEREGIVGAFVFAKSGLYENLVALDYSSLYPTIITTFNLSKEMRDINGQIFINNIKLSDKEVGLMPTIVNNLMILRKEYDRERKKYDIGSPEYDKYNSLLDSAKCVHCTCYGTQAYSGFRLFDSKIAETITKTGQELIKKSKDLVESLGNEVVYADTDSIYVKLSNVSNIKEIIDKGYYLVKEINNMAKEWCKTKGVESGGTFNIKFEKIYSKLLVSAKKRYAGKVIWKDDKEEDSLHITGMAFKRSDNSKFSRDFQKKALNILLSIDGGYDKMLEYIENEYSNIINNKYNFEYIGMPNKINKLPNNYHTTLPKLRALLWAKENINKSYDIGTKILILPIKNNKYDFMGFEFESDIINIKNNITLNYEDILRREIYLVMITIFEVLKKEEDLEKLNDKYLSLLGVVKKQKRIKKEKNILPIETPKEKNILPLNLPENFKISKSMYNLFNSCNKQFYYSYANYPREINEISKEIMQFGTDYHNIMKLNNINQLKEIPDKFKPLMSIHNEMIIPEIQMYGFNHKNVLLAEEKITYDNINGIIDVVFNGVNGNLIIDYKTVLSLKNDFSKYKPELLIYAYLLNKTKNIPYNEIKIGIEMVEQKTGLSKLQLIEFNESDIINEIKNVNEVYNFIKNNKDIKNYKKISEDKTNKICKYCDFYKICE